MAGDNEFLWRPLSLPVSKKGDKPEYGYKTRPVMMVSAAVTTNCSNVELAARLLDYGYTEEGHILFNGIEGESLHGLTRTARSILKYTDLILNNPDGLSITHAMGPYTEATTTE